VVTELRAAGATWIQFDEPTLVKDLDAHQLQAFNYAYSELESTLSGLNVLVETYFADVPAEAYKTLTSLKAVTAYGFDLVRGIKTLDLIKQGFPSGKLLFAGIVDGRNIWANNLESSLNTLKELGDIVGKGTYKLLSLVLLIYIVRYNLNLNLNYHFLLQRKLWFPHPVLFFTLQLIW
jgi:5-methyltetrahydropteroyltriglutamate--homocysteine methyltransferase